MTAEFLRGISLKFFYGLIDVKPSEVGLCSRRLFRRGECLSPLHHVFIGQCSCVPLAWERKIFNPSAIAEGDCALYCGVAVK